MKNYQYYHYPNMKLYKYETFSERQVIQAIAIVLITLIKKIEII